MQVPAALDDVSAGKLFDELTKGKSVDGSVRSDVLKLLAGHPLAMTWSCGALSDGDDDPGALVSEWLIGCATSSRRHYRYIMRNCSVVNA